MNKTIIELCKGLPATESELRARAEEFGREMALKVMGWGIHSRNTVFYVDPAKVDSVIESKDIRHNRNKYNPLNNIADAKAATDAVGKRGATFRVTINRDGSALVEAQCWSGDEIIAEVRAEASTEECARAAAALLAADAMAAMKGER